MYTCPSCGQKVDTSSVFCGCGADLSLLHSLDALADAWLNRALSAVSRRSPGLALEWLSAACAARPSDSQARLALAKVWARLGHLKEARHSLSLVRLNDPGNPGIAPIEKALRDAQRNAGKKPVTKPAHISEAPGASTVGRRRKISRKKSKKRK